MDTTYETSNERTRLTGRVVHAIVTFVVFAALVGVGAFFDLLPELRTSSSEAAMRAVLAEEAALRAQREAQIPQDVTPRRIIIEEAGVDVAIASPDSTDIAVLDNALLQGVVHYPGSGNLEDISNMLLFGHSSSLPVVHNQHFKVFNHLKDLSYGDRIRVQSSTHEYLYRVESVKLTRAQDALVKFDTDEKQLTLSTCNSFGEKSERYVVTATFVGRYTIEAYEEAGEPRIEEA